MFNGTGNAALPAGGAAGVRAQPGPAAPGSPGLHAAAARRGSPQEAPGRESAERSGQGQGQGQGGADTLTALVCGTPLCPP